MARLEDLEVVEVSLVDHPANKRKFLLMKNKGDGSVDELIALILETEAENEADLDAVLAERDLPEDTEAAVRGTFRLLNAHRETLTEDIVKAVMIKSGFLTEQVEEVTDEVENVEDESDEVVTEEVEKAEESDDPLAEITKADGTIDLDSVPEAVRPALEQLWRERHDAEEERQELEKALQDERQEKRSAEMITKAKGYGLPGDAEMVANLLMKTEDEDPDKYAALATWLESISAIVKGSDLFDEIGHGGDEDDEDSGYAVAKKRADTQGVDVNTILKNDRELAERVSVEARSGS